MMTHQIRHICLYGEQHQVHASGSQSKVLYLAVLNSYRSLQEPFALISREQEIEKLVNDIQQLFVDFHIIRPCQYSRDGSSCVLPLHQ